MPYLIDGHNLVPKMGLRLDAPDDEMQLLALIQDFMRLKRRDAHLYFDGAPAGHAGSKRYGAVQVHFVPAESTADAAIKLHIRRLGAAARNWTVVTSDRAIQVEARSAHARVMSSEEFASELRNTGESPAGRASQRPPSESEVEEWLRLFGGKK